MSTDPACDLDLDLGLGDDAEIPPPSNPGSTYAMSRPDPNWDKPRPHGRRVLLRTHIAGTRYHRAREVLTALHVGRALSLRREPKNPHDAQAIAIDLIPAPGQDAVMLGYIPRSENPLPAELLDSGHPLTCTVVSAELSLNHDHLDFDVELGWVAWPGVG